MTNYLSQPDGRIAYDVVGSGPTILLVPGMGDLRATYRFLVPELVAAGFQVVTTDLRGHGDSDTTFTSYGDIPTATDLISLISAVGDSPVVIVGNSMGAGSAVLVAAERPELVAGLVLIGPFVRNPVQNPVVRWLTTALLRVMMMPAWAASAWKLYLPKLYAGTAPVDSKEYRDRVVASLRRPGYARAFSQTTHTSHAPAEAALVKVQAPTLVVMGELDPDFRDPIAEANWIAQQLRAQVKLVSEAGHYPQSQRPAAVAPAVVEFATSVLGHDRSQIGVDDRGRGA